MTDRWDETWHRLREWTNGQGPSERLAAQILLDDAYEGLDPSHPLGGKDGGKDAICYKHGQRWIMAVYFPRGQQDFATIKDKFISDVASVAQNSAIGIVFVTNQELRLSERKELASAAPDAQLDLFHLERITAVLDKPTMASVRKQFLNIGHSEDVAQPITASVAGNDIAGSIIVTQNQMGGQAAHSITNIGQQPRRVSSEVAAVLVAKLKMHPPEEVDLLVANDAESHSLKEVLKGALLAASWTVCSDAIDLAPTTTGINIAIRQEDKQKASFLVFCLTG